MTHKWNKHFDIRKSNFYQDFPLELSQHQKEIIIGSLLGDGCLKKTQGKRNSSFSERHSLKQAEYLEWKYENLKPFSSSIYELETIGRKKVGNKVLDDNKKKYQCKCMTTYVAPCFSELEKKWYKRDKNGKYLLKDGRRIKILPVNLKLTPLILSVYYCDDGWISQKRWAAYICCNCFSKKECDYLSNQITEMGFKNKVHINSGNNLPDYIRILSESFEDFLNMVKKNIPCSSIAYKHDMSKLKKPFYLRKPTEFDDLDGSFLRGLYEKNGYWFVAIRLMGKYKIVGKFKSREIALSVNRKAYQLRSQGIVDMNKYKKLATKYNSQVKEIKPKNYWTNLDNLKYEIKKKFPKLIAKNKFPTGKMLKDVGLFNILMNRFGSLSKMAKILEIETDQIKWTKEKVYIEFGSIIKKLGRFPKQIDLPSNLAGVYRKYGSTNDFRDYFGFEKFRKVWTENDIQKELSEVIAKNNGKFVGSWTLNKMGKNDLVRAVGKNGGFEKWRKIMNKEMFDAK